MDLICEPGVNLHRGGALCLTALMIRVPPAPNLRIVAFLLSFLLAACAPYPKIPVNGYLANKRISTTVDSILARDYFEHSFSGPEVDRISDEQVADIERRFAARPLDWLTLKELSKETSPDFATLFFIKRSLSDATNERFQSSYSKEVKRIKYDVQHNRWTGMVRARLRRYKVLFIPGFHYLSNQTTGADFFNQRKLMGQLGLDVQLAATEEDGTVEGNAAIIADTVRAESNADAKLILVSTSKGGPETALALGKILQPGETTAVKAWVSVGGLIRGTFLVDRVVGWPKSWLTKIILSVEGIQFRGLPGLTTTASRQRMNDIRLPRHILILQFVGAPFSGDITKEVKARYLGLRRYGPNDGLTLLADELLPNGITIIEPGLDHYYEDPDIYLKSLALPNVIVDNLNGGAPRMTLVGR
jgi:hypothetical protein